MPACDAATLIATAMAAGYAKLSDRDLRECILASACAGGGGGGGGVTNGVANPVAAPIGGSGVYVQGTGPGVHVWVFDGLAWQEIV